MCKIVQIAHVQGVKSTIVHTIAQMHNCAQVAPVWRGKKRRKPPHRFFATICNYQ